MSLISGAMSALAKLLELHLGRCPNTSVHLLGWVARSFFSHTSWGDPVAQPAPPSILVHSVLMATICQLPMSKL